MEKINILPASVYNKIAAGEVIDRPYSVVKELVENAMDAGATEIQVYIENGGKRSIRVVDNGCGIAYEDFHAAFLPHATSKIEKASDLANVVTLGFRGEAVASIASVSKTTITSKTESGKCYSLTSNGGELGNIVETTGEKGTEVRVEELFFNIPVRYGFLKTEKGEETDITNFISRFILNRPEIAFTYYADGKKILQSFGGGKEEALVNVYGASILDNCYEIKAERHGIKISGYIGNQNYSKPNKTYQSLFVNGRYIVNNTVTTAVTKAYSAYLMKRQYPFFVLYLEVPHEIVDVNVHPNKADVRFTNNQIIFGVVHNVIAAVLDGQSRAFEYVVATRSETASSDNAVPDRGEEKTETQAERLSRSIDRFNEKFASKSSEKPVDFFEIKEESQRGSERGAFLMSYEDAKKEIEESSPVFTNKKKTGIELPFNFGDNEKPAKIQRIFEPFTAEKIGAEEMKNVKRSGNTGSGIEKLLKDYPDLHFERNVLEVNASERKEDVEPDCFEENKKYLAELDLKTKNNKIEVSNCRFVGKLFNTYLLYELRDDVYVIDQHASHERLIFDRLKEQMKARKVNRQPMLFPYQLDLNAFESEFIRENLSRIREMGFDVEEYGATSFKVTAVPVDLQHVDLSVFFNDILGDVSGYRSIKLEDLLKDKLASAACKAAVKGGMDLTQGEIDKLFELMDGDMGLKCPHGRPVVVKTSKTQIEKAFKRIV